MSGALPGDEASWSDLACYIQLTVHVMVLLLRLLANRPITTSLSYEAYELWFPIFPEVPATAFSLPSWRLKILLLQFHCIHYATLLVFRLFYDSIQTGVSFIHVFRFFEILAF